MDSCTCSAVVKLGGRSKFELDWLLLKAVKTPSRISHLVYHVGTNAVVVKQRLKFLESKGFIKVTPVKARHGLRLVDAVDSARIYYITLLGSEFLGKLDSIFVIYSDSLTYSSEVLKPTS